MRLSGDILCMFVVDSPSTELKINANISSLQNESQKGKLTRWPRRVDTPSLCFLTDVVANPADNTWHVYRWHVSTAGKWKGDRCRLCNTAEFPIWERSSYGYPRHRTTQTQFQILKRISLRISNYSSLPLT